MTDCNKTVAELSEWLSGDTVSVILDHTPFYAQSGGQVGDIGVLRGADFEFVVSDTIKLAGVYHAHIGQLRSGMMGKHNMVKAIVDEVHRDAVVLNHSATHLLHAALRNVLGDHVTQKGSLVAADRLRFDFSHFSAMTPEQLREVENLVNEQVRSNVSAEVRVMAQKDAMASGAMALFGEKYGDEVRVLKMGEFSTELCGGTHVDRVGDIGVFKILSEGGVASGVRRVEAVTGAGALAAISQQENDLREAAELLGGTADDIVAKVHALLDRQKKLERELEILKVKAASAASSDLFAQAKDVQGIKVLTARLENVEAKNLREMIDDLKNRLTNAVIVLAAVADGKASLVAGVSGNASAKIKAGDVLSMVAKQIGGKGGGRADMAQGGGEDSPALPGALASVEKYVVEQLV
jgi:alanyl-tRNA synthetase